MKKISQIVLVTGLVCSMAVTPVFASPTETLESQRAEAENEADALQQELTELLNKMGQLEEDLIAKGEEIIQAEADLEEAEEQADAQYEAMKLRIKYMYENGTSSALETLMGAESFSDFINCAEYVAETHLYDRQKLEEYINTTEKIEALKAELEDDQKNMQEMQAEYQQEETSLNEALTAKRAEIADFDEQIQAAAEAAAALAVEREQAEDDTSGNDTTDSNGGTSNSGGENTTPPTSDNSNSGNNSGSSGGNTSVAQAIVNAAYSQLGVPYVYGGTSSSGWDCSGLVQYCHSVAGISLPRTSQAQGGCGIAVSNPQPGDIVCYGYHVGIYIGNGQMIHAPKPGDVVKIAAVYGSPWYRRVW